MVGSFLASSTGQSETKTKHRVNLYRVFWPVQSRCGMPEKGVQEELLPGKKAQIVNPSRLILKAWRKSTLDFLVKLLRVRKLSSLPLNLFPLPTLLLSFAWLCELLEFLLHQMTWEPNPVKWLTSHLGMLGSGPLTRKWLSQANRIIRLWQLQQANKPTQNKLIYSSTHKPLLPSLKDNIKRILWSMLGITCSYVHNYWWSKSNEENSIVVPQKKSMI